MNDDLVDKALRKYLSGELDGQVGRAALVVELAAGRYRLRVAAWAAVAAAAGLAVILLWPRGPVSMPVEPTVAATPVEYQLESQTIDQGTVYLDDETPAQQYVERQIETARWVDPVTHAHIELTVPRDRIVLVGLTSY